MVFQNFELIRTFELQKCGNRLLDLEPLIPLAMTNRHYPLLAILWILHLFALSPSLQAGRKALIIGNGSYQNYSRLSDPLNDADLMYSVLLKLDFSPYRYKDLTVKGLKSAFEAFHSQIESGDEVIVYYSGHGIQFNGENFILPIDGKFASADQLKSTSVSIESLLEQVQKMGVSVSVVFLDSCRTDGDLLAGEEAIASSTGAIAKSTKGSPTASTGSGDVLTFFATQHGTPAFEGPGLYSLFTQALAEQLIAPNQDLNQVIVNVRNEVIRISNGRQKPFTYGSVGRQIVWTSKESDVLELNAMNQSGNQMVVGVGSPSAVSNSGFVQTISPLNSNERKMIVSYSGSDGVNIRDSRTIDSSGNLHGALFQQTAIPLRQLGDPVEEGGREWIQLKVAGWIPIKNRRQTFLEPVGERKWKVIWNKPGDNFVAMRTTTISTSPLICEVAYATILTENGIDQRDPHYHYIFGTFDGWVVKRSQSKEYVREYFGD